MCGFFTKNRYLADLLEGSYDIHCHLLPGVDDGSPDRNTSLELLKAVEDMGMRGLYMTPHIINGMYENHNESDMREVFEKLLYKHKTKMDIRLAAEYFIDERFPEHMQDEPLTMSGKHILAEFELNSYGLASFDMLFDVSMAGYNVIIAHPERYTFVQGDRSNKVLNLITNSRYKMQLNLLSLTGYHGGHARKMAEKMLEEGLYDYIGTDTHSAKYLDMLKESKVPAKVFSQLEKLRGNNEGLFADN